MLDKVETLTLCKRANKSDNESTSQANRSGTQIYIRLSPLKASNTPTEEKNKTERKTGSDKTRKN